MKICYLGAGSWGFALASLLASKGHSLMCWTTKEQLAETLNKTREHPLLPGFPITGQVVFTTSLEKALDQADLIVESVTSAGVRTVFNQLKALNTPKCPIVLTSKGIEQDTCLILPDVIIDIFGVEIKEKIALLSGPSYASEVLKGLPVSVVAAAYNPEIAMQVADFFKTGSFRVYPNLDIKGVAYGGALKNIIAIACGISDGLSLGSGSSAALITRGLHEIRKLAVAYSCKAETLYGLSGVGDICMTCTSVLSRNFRYGRLLSQGLSVQEAKEKIGMVVEGAYTCVSALQLSQKAGISMPITEMVYQILYNRLNPSDAIPMLMQRSIKEEHL